MILGLVSDGLNYSPIEAPMNSSVRKGSPCDDFASFHMTSTSLPEKFNEQAKVSEALKSKWLKLSYKYAWKPETWDKRNTLLGPDTDMDVNRRPAQRLRSGVCEVGLYLSFFFHCLSLAKLTAPLVLAYLVALIFASWVPWTSFCLASCNPGFVLVNPVCKILSTFRTNIL